MSDDKGVQSVERALDIIESAASRQEGKSLTEISADTGLHKSTAYRIINTLVRRGFLMREDDGNYKLGHKLIETASYYINELELQTRGTAVCGRNKCSPRPRGISGCAGRRKRDISGKDKRTSHAEGLLTDRYPCAGILLVSGEMSAVGSFQRQDRANHGGMQFYKIHAQYDLQHGRTPQRADKSPQTGMGHG